MLRRLIENWMNYIKLRHLLRYMYVICIKLNKKKTLNKYF